MVKLNSKTAVLKFNLKATTDVIKLKGHIYLKGTIMLEYKKLDNDAMAGMAQWIECQPAN